MGTRICDNPTGREPISRAAAVVRSEPKDAASIGMGGFGPASVVGAGPDIAVARRVLEMEIAGLRDLARSLDGRFVEAVDRLSCITGRVIVTGMGKSGHIAHKIAATLASTGTPAHYVHPAEASHGDLGMVVSGDAVIALSSSGETVELLDIVNHCRRASIPLIALTRVGDSSLATASDIALVLPASAEACPLGLAPTTSTTAMLALGDALAVALLERKGFSTQDYRLVHPGGALGRKLLRVSDVMHSGDAVPTIAPHCRMSDAILVITQKTFGCVGVVDDSGRLVGIVTDGDLRRHMGPGLLEAEVVKIMSVQPKTIGPAALAAEALATMNRHSISNLFVLNGEGRPAGIIRLLDCLRAGIA